MTSQRDASRGPLMVLFALIVSCCAVAVAIFILASGPPPSWILIGALDGWRAGQTPAQIRNFGGLDSFTDEEVDRGHILLRYEVGPSVPLPTGYRFQVTLTLQSVGGQQLNRSRFYRVRREMSGRYSILGENP